MATPTAPAQVAPAAHPLDPAGVRAVVAAQPTVAGSVAALVVGISGSMAQALKHADPQGLQKFSEALGSDPKAWADAVLANTPDAVLTATSFLAVPGHLQEVFTEHAAAQAKHAEGQPAKH